MTDSSIKKKLATIFGIEELEEFMITTFWKEVVTLVWKIVEESSLDV